jgi:hypothetical protein
MESKDLFNEEKADSVSPDGRRRRLLIGLAATPAVLTLMNRSAWGAAQGEGPPCSMLLSLSLSRLPDHAIGPPEDIPACDDDQQGPPRDPPGQEVSSGNPNQP